MHQIENADGQQTFRVFKFRSGNSFDLDALFDNYVWFSGLSELNDPYEGYASLSDEGIDDDYREQFLAAVYAKAPLNNECPREEAKKFRNGCNTKQGIGFSEYINLMSQKIIKDYYEEHKNDFKILSLSLAKDGDDFPAPLNNMLMWSHYADGFKGFCVEFDFVKLKKSIEVKLDSELGTSTIDYATEGKLPVVKMKTFMQSTIDDSKDCSLEILTAFTKKEQSWFYESEVRLFSETIGKHCYDPECINAIYISERTPSWLKQSLNTYVSLNKIALYQVSLHHTEYKFGYQKIYP